MPNYLLLMIFFTSLADTQGTPCSRMHYMILCFCSAVCISVSFFSLSFSRTCSLIFILTSLSCSLWCVFFRSIFPFFFAVFRMDEDSAGALLSNHSLVLFRFSRWVVVLWWRLQGHHLPRSKSMSPNAFSPICQRTVAEDGFVFFSWFMFQTSHPPENQLADIASQPGASHTFSVQQSECTL